MNPDGLLDGRYRLLERIGGGGMAEVYLAEDVLLTRQVAVKILRSQFTGDEDFVTRFRQEARAAARLSHANIVSIFDVGCEADRHYIVMEYVAGETLKDLIKRDGPLSPVRAAEIAAVLDQRGDAQGLFGRGDGGGRTGRGEGPPGGGAAAPDL